MNGRTNASASVGGMELNFEVVGGAIQPSNPKENTIWVNIDAEITRWDFQTVIPYRQSVNKNLVCYPFYHTTLTENGVTFTDNGDGTVKANGTATALARFRWAHMDDCILLQPGTYTASGCPAGGSDSTYYFELWDKNNDELIGHDYGENLTFTLTKPTAVRGSLIARKGASLNNLVFKPQIEKGSVATDFVKGDATGQVWIATGTSSDSKFNALKKNGIVVCPLTAKQYVSGVWAYKDAFIYQAGAWKKLGLYLYNNGNDYTDKTGGWTTSTPPTYQSAGMSANSANNCLEISKIGKPTGSWPALGWKTNWRIDFSGYSSLHFSYIAEGTASVYTEIHFTVLDDSSGSFNYIANKTVNVGNQGELILDVKNISAGKVFFYICDSTYEDNKINLRVSEVWLT